MRAGGAHPGVPPRPVLHGRDKVLAQLCAALVHAAAGDVVVAMIEGEPGSGKTALGHEIAARAVENGFPVVQVTGVEGEADLPLAGLSVLLRPLMDLVDRLPSGQQRAIRAAVGLSDDRIFDRFTLGAATLGLLSVAAERAPLLVLLDDAEWLDGPSADALSFAIRRLQADAVMVLVTARPGACSLTLPQNALRLRIGGLSEPQVIALLDDAGWPVTVRVAASIVGATAGLPLAVLETAAALSPEQRSGLVRLPEPLPIGSRVIRAYRDRLVGLPARTRRAVALAAIAGSAPIETVVAALEDLDLGLADLEPAEDVGALTVTDSGLSFTHPLLRAAGLNLLPPGSRRALHHALANAASEDPERRARHLMAAATGPDEQVAAALEVAAAQAQRRGGLAAAAPALAQAAAFTKAGEHRESRLLVAAQALAVAGHTEDARPLAEKIVATTVDPLRRADAMLVILNSAFWTPSNNDVITRALDEVSRITPIDRGRAVQILLQASLVAIIPGGFSLALQLAEQALDLLDSETPPATEMEARHVYAYTLALTGRQSEARRFFDKWTTPRSIGIDAAELHGNRYGWAVQSLIRLGQYAQAEQLVRALLEVCRHESAPSAKAYMLAAASELWWWRGQWPQALSLSEESIALAEQTGQVVLSWFVRAVVARVLAGQGEHQRCQSYIDHAMSAAHAHGYKSVCLFALAAQGFLELGMGHPAAAAALLRDADDIRRSCGCREPAAVPLGS